MVQYDITVAIVYGELELVAMDVLLDVIDCYQLLFIVCHLYVRSPIQVRGEPETTNERE